MGAALAAMVVAATIVTLGACSPSDPHVYDKVDAVADGLGLRSIGTTVYEGRYGTGKFSAPAPTLIWVVAGPDVKTHIDQALVRAGYSPQIANQPVGTPESWARAEERSAPIVSVLVLPAGSTFQDAEQKNRAVTEDAVEVFVSS